MTKHFHVFLWIPLLYCALFLIFWIKIYANEAVSFEEFVLEKQVNYASESAVDEMLAAGNLNQDYADGDFVTLEPDVAIDDFVTTLCYDYDIIPTDDTIETFRNKNLRTMAICVYDGVYLYYKQQTETHGYELKQSPKIPYFYTDNSGNQYCLTLNTDKGYWDEGGGSSYKLHFYDKYDVKPSDDIQKATINKQVADLINWALWETYTSEAKGDTAISIPATGETVRGTQPVRSPTVIGIVEGKLKSYGSVVLAECIGGAQLETTDQIVGFRLKNCPIYIYKDPSNGLVYTGDKALELATDAGVDVADIIDTTVTGKFYARSSWWQEHKYAKSYTDNSNNNKYSRYFDSEYEAAKSGYNDLNLCD